MELSCGRGWGQLCGEGCVIKAGAKALLDFQHSPGIAMGMWVSGADRDAAARDGVRGGGQLCLQCRELGVHPTREVRSDRRALSGVDLLTSACRATRRPDSPGYLGLRCDAGRARLS